MNMEEKLELRHLAPYLPYELRCRIKDYPVRIGENYADAEATLHGIYSDGSCVFHDIVESHQGFQMIKPLLHPLSRLTEPILEGGKIPIEELKPNDLFWVNDVFDDGKCLNLFNGATNFVVSKQNGSINEYIPYLMIEKLFKWHMDVFNLIPQGLAIPIEPQPKKTK